MHKKIRNIKEYTHKNEEYISISMFAKKSFISRQGAENRLKNNVGGISDSTIVVFFMNGKVSDIKEYKDKDSIAANARIKRYFIKASFVEERCEEKLTPRERSVLKNSFSESYYRVLGIIEEKLTREEKSIATEKQKWGNMKIVDREICGEIFYRYERDEGIPLNRALKQDIRTGVEKFYFNTSKALKIAEKYIKEALNDYL